MYNATAAMDEGFKKNLPMPELSEIKLHVRLIATNKLQITVKKNRNLPTACKGVKPLPGVLAIRMYN
jgi:hypothetical protein